MEGYSEYNLAVRQWALNRAREMNYKMNSLGIHATGKLFMSLRSLVDEFYGKASVIRFKFPRYGVFVEKGVGRGYPIESVRTNGLLLSGSSKRVPKPWFSMAISERDIDDLALIVGDQIEEINVRLIKSSFSDSGMNVKGEEPTMADVANMSDFEQAAFQKYFLD